MCARALPVALQGVMPDIVTMAKGIGNGLPLAAVVTTPQIAEVCQTRGLGALVSEGVTSAIPSIKAIWHHAVKSAWHTMMPGSHVS